MNINELQQIFQGYVDNDYGNMNVYGRTGDNYKYKVLLKESNVRISSYHPEDTLKASGRQYCLIITMKPMFDTLIPTDEDKQFTVNEFVKLFDDISSWETIANPRRVLIEFVVGEHKYYRDVTNKDIKLVRKSFRDKPYLLFNVAIDYNGNDVNPPVWTE